jgi:hypothetical protein
MENCKVYWDTNKIGSSTRHCHGEQSKCDFSSFNGSPVLLSSRSSSRNIRQVRKNKQLDKPNLKASEGKEGRPIPTLVNGVIQENENKKQNKSIMSIKKILVIERKNQRDTESCYLGTVT